MKTLRVVAIDDEPLALKLICSYLQQFPHLQLVQAFEDAVSGAEYLNQYPVDILFVDINMPDITGIDLVRTLQKKPVVIFATAYKNFAYEGFELEAVDYLLKPIDFNRFAKAVGKAVDYINYKSASSGPQREDAIYVYSEYRMVRIDLAQIEYIESMEDYIKIYLSDERRILTLMPLKKMLEKLPAERFQRIHRSYIVALDKIKLIRQRKVQLAGTELPISDSFADMIYKLMENSRTPPR